MRIDVSAAERFLAYLDGDRSLSAVWEHPAYDVARAHAEVLERDLSPGDLTGGPEDGIDAEAASPAENRERIERLLDHVRGNEAEWTDLIEEHLGRVTPDEDLSEVTLYLAVGYGFGVGLGEGAFVNLNRALFFRDPRQLLYTGIHECSHVVYESVHDFASEVGPEDFRSAAGQRRVFEALFHTEAFATYTPLALRRAEGAMGAHDHPVAADYRVLGDDDHLRELVAEYDSFRETLRDGPVPREELLGAVFGGSRLPYRVGCATLDRIERTEGMGAVTEAFHLDPAEFLEECDPVLDAYRAGG